MESRERMEGEAMMCLRRNGLDLVMEEIMAKEEWRHWKGRLD
jgi:hypothetical protein